MQAWNRYSYVTNRPVNFTDPTGHIGCDEDINGNCLNNPSEERILGSLVYLIFGNEGEGDNVIGYQTGGSGGIGVVVEDRTTIVTAEHVYMDNIDTQDTLFVQASGSWVTYELADVTVEYGPGDIVTLTLPSDIEGYVIPASTAQGYHVAAGQTVVTTYAEPVPNENGMLAEFDLFATFTTISDPPVGRATNLPYGNQIVATNPGRILNSGDSGGGVFHNGDLIGVNSAIDGSGLFTIAPQCFSWYSEPLRAMARPC